MDTLRVFEAFAGYGSQSMALKRLGIDFEVVGISEIDKYAIQAYNAVHGETRNYGDISKINWDDVPDFDFFTYSFPCTDISSAGQQKGLEEGSGTRSSLLWECRKAIEAKKPKYLMMENVKALTSKKFTPYLKMWLNYLSELGYSNYTQVLNAKDYGVPQNRERVFVVSVLGDECYEFPKPFKLELRLKDILEKDVDDGYYLSEKMIDCFTRRTKIAKEKGNGFRFSPTDGNCIAKAITTCAGNRTDDNFICKPLNTDKDGLCKTIKAQYYKNSTKNFLEKGAFGATGVISCDMRGRNLGYHSDRTSEIPTEQLVDIGGNVANYVTTLRNDNLVDEPKILANDYRIRKLTPRECFRLMGVLDIDIDKIQAAGISKTQQYKMAGNSIVVDVLYHIFRKLFVDRHSENSQLSLFLM